MVFILLTTGLILALGSLIFSGLNEADLAMARWNKISSCRPHQWVRNGLGKLFCPRCTWIPEDEIPSTPSTIS